MDERRTILADSLEAELMAQSPEPSWRFVVREAVCESCQGELVIVRLYGHSYSFPHPLCKTWYADEVRRRKSMREFAGTLIRQLSGN